MASSVSSHPYKIHVTPQPNNHGFTDDQNLKSPTVTFKCIINMSYVPYNKPDGCIRAFIPAGPNNQPPEIEHPADELTGHLLSTTVFSSPPIPFELNNLHWKQQIQDKESVPVMSIEDIVNSMLQVCHSMISQSSRKKHRLYVYVKKEVIVPDEIYLAMLKAKEQKEVLKQLQNMFRLQAQGWNFGPSDWKMMTDELRKVGLGNSIRNILDSARRRAIRESSQSAMVRAVPAAAMAVEALEKVTLLSNGSTDTKETCIICIEEMPVGSQVTRMPCSHVFHGPCIEKWLKERSHMCPICRFKLKTDSSSS